MRRHRTPPVLPPSCTRCTDAGPCPRAPGDLRVPCVCPDQLPRDSWGLTLGSPQAPAPTLEPRPKCVRAWGEWRTRWRAGWLWSAPGVPSQCVLFSWPLQGTCGTRGGWEAGRRAGPGSCRALWGRPVLLGPGAAAGGQDSQVSEHVRGARRRPPSAWPCGRYGCREGVGMATTRRLQGARVRGGHRAVRSGCLHSVSSAHCWPPRVVWRHPWREGWATGPS